MSEALHILSIASILIIWLKTEAFVEYAELFGFGFTFSLPDYYQQKENDPSLTYLDYLAINHDCFFTRLIICPYCLAFWFSLLASLSYGKITFLPLFYIGSLSTYGAVNKLLS